MTTSIHLPTLPPDGVEISHILFGKSPHRYFAQCLKHLLAEMAPVIILPSNKNIEFQFPMLHLVTL